MNVKRVIMTTLDSCYHFPKKTEIFDSLAHACTHGIVLYEIINHTTWQAFLHLRNSTHIVVRLCVCCRATKMKRRAFPKFLTTFKEETEDVLMHFVKPSQTVIRSILLISIWQKWNLFHVTSLTQGRMSCKGHCQMHHRKSYVKLGMKS